MFPIAEAVPSTEAPFEKWDPSDDPVGTWFWAIEANREWTLIRMGEMDAEGDLVKWHIFPHGRFDGLGALAEIWRSYGAKIDKLPEGNLSQKPKNFWERMASARKALSFRPATKVEWISSEKWDREQWIPEFPKAFAWKTLSEHDTSELELRAKSLGVSVNSLLLESMHAVCGSALTLNRDSLTWMLPVNLRGGVPAQRDTQNQSSYVGVDLPVGASISQVHEAYRNALKSGRAWGHWALGHLSLVLGPRWTKAFVRREHAVPQVGWFGAFANLGSWDVVAMPDSIRDKDWIVFGPVRRVRPIGVACLVWAGRLTITLQLHASLSTDPRFAQKLLDDALARAAAR